MRFDFDDEQLALKRSARGFLEAHSSSAKVRAAMTTPLGFDAELWARVGSELGWPSLIVPEAYGGAGLGAVELTALMEELGRSLCTAPFFSSVGLATQVLLQAATDAQKAELLPSLASGARRATLAHAERGGSWDAHSVTVALTPASDGFVLAGEKRHVLDGHSADVLIVSARTPETRGADGVSLVVVDATAPGVTRRAHTTMDPTRRQAEVALDGVRVPASAVLGSVGGAAAALARALDRAAIALAAEQVGGAERCLELATEYAKVRTQFGRAIGSFQAVKHVLADVLVLVETARSAAYYAAWAASVPETSAAELAVLASTARVHCSEAYYRAAAECIQVHGGIGFTWEHDAHLHFKRARASRSLLGEPSVHRELVAVNLGL